MIDCNSFNFLLLFLGRRVCPGESSAKMALFLYFSSLMHQYKFELPAGVDTPSVEPVPGFALAPQPFQVIIKEH